MPVSDQGVNLDRYMLVPRTLIFATQDDKVLLLKGAKSKRLWAGLFNGIGGHVEQGEDILSAAKRELEEETGLVAAHIWLCGIVTIDTQTNPGVCVYLFKADSLEGKLKESDEGSLEWIPISEINQLPLVSDLYALLPKIMALEPGDKIISAHSKYDTDGKLTINFG